MGWVNVKDFGAKGDGVTDDTKAITNALFSVKYHIKLYFPKGKYIVSNTIGGDDFRWKSMIGEDKTTTVIQLKDNCPGYTDTNSPKAMFYTRGGNESFQINITT